MKLIRWSLFSTIKDWGIPKSDQTIVYLKKCWLLVNEIMEKLFKYKCYETGSCSEEALSSKNYLLKIITYSGEKAPPKQ